MVNKTKKFLTGSLGRSYKYIQPFLPDRYFPYRFFGGKIYLNIKESPMMFARALGVYEQQKTNAVRSLLSEGKTFIDIGVNKGDFSLLAARIVGETGTVLSFEPEPENCEWIKKSIEINGYENIMLYELALSDTNGTARLYLGEKSGFHTLLPDKKCRQEGVINIKARTLDSIMEENNYQERVSMMKIDVEGAELSVLEGARETLLNNSEITLLIDLHPELGVDQNEICDFLSNLDFSIYEMREPFNIPVQIGKNLSEVLARRDFKRNE